MPVPPVAWFRPPADGDPGTLNACYNALDIHVIRGRAEDVALTIAAATGPSRGCSPRWRPAPGCCAPSASGSATRSRSAPCRRGTGVVVALAAARVGAVARTTTRPPPTADGRVASADDGVVLAADGEELPWDVAKRAGRTDPAGCADVPGDAVLSRRGDDALPVLDGRWARRTTTTPRAPGATLVRGRRPGVVVVRRA